MKVTKYIIISRELLDKLMEMGHFKTYANLIKSIIIIYVTQVSMFFKPRYIYMNGIENNIIYSNEDLYGLLIQDFIKAIRKYGRENKIKNLTKTVSEIFTGFKSDIHIFNKKTYGQEVRFTIEEEYIECLDKLMNPNGNLSLTKQINLILEFMVYYYTAPNAFQYKRDKIFQLHGNKWNKSMIASMQSIQQQSGINPDYLVDFFGGILGVTMNISAQNYIINDLEKKRINLYTAIKENPVRLLNCILKYDFTKAAFERNVNHTYNISVNNDGTITPNYEDAAVYFHQMCLCIRDTENSYSRKKSYSGLKMIDHIFYYFEKLENAVLISMDAFDLLDNLGKYVPSDSMHNTLCIYDPPYYQVTGYRNAIDFKEKFCMREMQEISNKEIYLDLLLKSYRVKSEKKCKITFENTPVLHRYMVERSLDMGTKFLYFYRDLTEMNDAFRCDYLYYSDSFYKATDGKIKKERIITNISGCGSKTTANIP